MRTRIRHIISLQLGLLALSSHLLWPGSAWAGDDDRMLGEDRIYRSAYFLGRGDTGVSTADEEEALFYNPAGLAAGKGIYKKTVLVSPHLEVSNSTRTLARRLALEEDDTVDVVLDQIGKPNHFGFSNFSGLILRRAAVGAIASGQIDVLASKSSDSGLEQIQASATQTTGGVFGIAQDFWGGRLLLGTTVKYIAHGRGYVEGSAADSEAVQNTLQSTSNFIGMGTGGGADLGLMANFGGRLNPRFGIGITDVGDTQISPLNESELNLDIKQRVNLGFSVEPGTRTSKLRLLVDYRDAAGAVHKSPLKRLHIGTELTVLDVVGFCAGAYQGYPTGSMYVDLYFMRLDIGAYTEELSEHVGRRPDTRFFSRLKIGF